MNTLPDVVGPRRRGRVLVPRFNPSAPLAMSKDWWLHLVAFGEANAWNPSYIDGLGTYYQLAPGRNQLFPTAPFGICLWDGMSPDLPSRAIEVGLGTATYAVSGRGWYRDMCWLLVTEGDDGPVVQVWLFKDDDLTTRSFWFPSRGFGSDYCAGNWCIYVVS